MNNIFNVRNNQKQDQTLSKKEFVSTFSDNKSNPDIYYNLTQTLTEMLAC